MRLLTLHLQLLLLQVCAAISDFIPSIPVELRMACSQRKDLGFGDQITCVQYVVSFALHKKHFKYSFCLQSIPWTWSVPLLPDLYSKWQNFKTSFLILALLPFFDLPYSFWPPFKMILYLYCYFFKIIGLEKSSVFKSTCCYCKGPELSFQNLSDLSQQMPWTRSKPKTLMSSSDFLQTQVHSHAYICQ